MRTLVHLHSLAVKSQRLTLFSSAGKSCPKYTTHFYSSVSPSRKQLQASKISFIASPPQITKLPEKTVANAAKTSNLKEITKKYGAVGIFVYIGVGCLDLGVTLGLIQLAGLEKVKALEQSVLYVVKNVGVKFGLTSPEEKNTEELLLQDDVKLNEIATDIGKPSFTSIFILAYDIHKTVMLPVRIGVTAYITPAVVRKLHQMGWSRYFPRLLAASTPNKP